MRRAPHVHRPWLEQQVGDKKMGVCRECGAFCIVEEKGREAPVVAHRVRR